MKKFKIIAGLIAFMATFALAQHGVLLGGGLNLSTMNVEEEDGVETSSRIGFNVGGSFEAQINQNFSIVPGLSLETRGMKGEVTDPFSGETSETVLKFLYLQIPVMLQGNFPAGSAVINVFAGPEAGFHLSSGWEEDGEDVDDDLVDEFLDMKTLDFGLSFGAGLEIPVGAVSLFARPSYYLGLTESIDEDGAEDSKHRNIKLQVGIKKAIGG